MTREEFDKEFKILADSYNEKLIDCHYNAFNNAIMPIDYIANYFKFLKDYYLITIPDDDNSKETEEKVTALLAITDSYDKYIQTKEALNKKELDQDTIKKYQEEKNKHWKAFIQLLALNLGDGN